MYKILKQKQFIPYGAQYIHPVREHGETVSVKYYVDSQGRAPAHGLNFGGLVLKKSELNEITGGKYNYLNEGFGSWMAKKLAAATIHCLESAQSGSGFNAIKHDSCDIHTYIVKTEDNAGLDDFNDVAEIWTPREANYQKGDSIGVKGNTYQGKVYIVEHLGAGDADNYAEQLEEWYGENYNPDSKIAEENTQEPMKALKDTTKVAGQNSHKPRKSDKSDGDKYGKNVKDDRYSSGDDIRGIRRYPHSDGEEELDAIHKAEIIDHPANTGKWMEVVTNKQIGAKMEDIAPIGSNFFLNEFDSSNENIVKIQIALNSLNYNNLKNIRKKHIEYRRTRMTKEMEQFHKSTNFDGILYEPHWYTSKFPQLNANASWFFEIGETYPQEYKTYRPHPESSNIIIRDAIEKIKNKLNINIVFSRGNYYNNKFEIIFDTEDGNKIIIQAPKRGAGAFCSEVNDYDRTGYSSGDIVTELWIEIGYFENNIIREPENIQMERM